MATTTTGQIGLIKPTQGTNEPANIFASMDINMDAIDAKFHLATGHKHTGATGDAPGITIGAASITNAMLAGSITASNLAGSIGATKLALTTVTNALAADVTLTTQNTYYDGPSVAQGTSGIWLCTGSVVLVDAAGVAVFQVKLWDGTTVIASATFSSQAAAQNALASLSGLITDPVANVRISVTNASRNGGLIKANVSGSTKDSVLTAVRIG